MLTSVVVASTSLIYHFCRKTKKKIADGNKQTVALEDGEIFAEYLCECEPIGSVGSKHSCADEICLMVAHAWMTVVSHKFISEIIHNCMFKMLGNAYLLSFL